MGTLQTILGQLGVDYSIYYQFGIIVVVFFLARILFLNKLKFVLEKREESTVVLEKKANRMLEKVESKSLYYKNLINDTHRKAFKENQERKQRALDEEKIVLNKAEEKANKHIEQNRRLFLRDIEQSKQDLGLKVEVLASQLINKIKEK